MSDSMPPKNRRRGAEGREDMAPVQREMGEPVEIGRKKKGK